MTDPEIPDADAAEQALRAADEVEEDDGVPAPSTPDADPADLVDQHRAVPDDEQYEQP